VCLHNCVRSSREEINTARLKCERAKRTKRTSDTRARIARLHLALTYPVTEDVHHVDAV